MKINLEHIQLLDAIDRLGSFTAAADEFCKAKSAITYAVKQMEEAVGMAIFDRSGHRAILTEAGKLLLSDGRKILGDVHDLESRVRSLTSGWESKLRIAYDDAVSFSCMLPLIVQFHEECRSTNLVVHAETLGGCWDAIIHNRADLAIGVSGLMPGRDETILKNLGLLHFDFVVAIDHPLAKAKQPLSSAQINRYPAVYLMDSARRLPEQNYDVQSSKRYLYVGSIDEKQRVISAGVGIGFLPRRVAEEAEKSHRLIIKKVDVVRPSVQMAAACHHKEHKGKAMQWWLRQIEDKANRGSWLS